MKLKNILLTAALAVVSIASANASMTYSNGDMILGISQINNANSLCYEVNLGNISSLLSLSAGSTLTWNLSTSDIGSNFGAGWANDSTVSWGVAGIYSKTASLTVGDVIYARNTSWVTGDVQYNVGSSTSTAAAQIYNMVKGTGNDSFVSLTSTGDDAKGALADSTSNYSWQKLSNADGYGSADSNSFSALQMVVTSFDDTNSSSLGLYVIDPSAAKDSDATLVGNFTLGDDGTLTFAAVPEPSTYAMIGIGGLAMLRIMRRRRNA